MAPLGRFLDLDSHDFLNSSLPLEMGFLQNTIPFVVADQLMIVDERPTMIILEPQEVLKLTIYWQLKASLRHRTFPISEMKSAPRAIQAGCHNGKVVAVPRTYDMVKVSRKATTVFDVLSADASYVLAGDSGGLGEAQAL